MASVDARGNPVSSASGAARDLHERALWHLVSFYGDPLAALDAGIAADPGWALAHVAKAGFLATLTEPALLPQARDALASARSLVAGANARERSHLVAAELALAGQWHDACTLWDRILLEHPRDLLALNAAHLFDFYRGDARNLRQRVARVLPEWDTGDALFPFVLGMHAFGLEECNLYPQAEDSGRRAIEIDPRGPWSIHAVAHVMEMQGRHAEGIDWLATREADWADNGLAVHLWWHRALFMLETLDTAGALALHDAHIGGAASVVNLQWLDGAALLWRLQLLGVDTSARCRALVAAWADPLAHAGWYAFNDVHVLLAALLAGDAALADALVGACRARAEAGGDNGAMSREVALPLMHGLRAYAAGEAATAIDALWPLRPVAHHFGGSHAQRDLIDQTLLAAAALPGGDRRVGRALLNERRLAKPTTPLTAHWSARLA